MRKLYLIALLSISNAIMSSDNPVGSDFKPRNCERWGYNWEEVEPGHWHGEPTFVRMLAFWKDKPVSNLAPCSDTGETKLTPEELCIARFGVDDARIILNDAPEICGLPSKLEQDRIFDRERLLENIKALDSRPVNSEDYERIKEDRNKLKSLSDDLKDVDASIELRALRACRSAGIERCVGETLEGPHGDTYVYNPDTKTIYSKNAPMENFGKVQKFFSRTICDNEQNCTTDLKRRLNQKFREVISRPADLQDAKDAKENNLTHGEFQALRNAGNQVLIGSNDASEQSNGQLFVRFNVDDNQTSFPTLQTSLRDRMSRIDRDSGEMAFNNSRCSISDRIANCTIDLRQRKEREQCDSSLSSNFSVRDNLLVDSTFRTQLLAVAGRDSSTLSLDEVRARLGN